MTRIWLCRAINFFILLCNTRKLELLEKVTKVSIWELTGSPVVSDLVKLNGVGFGM